jgi:receptor-type tyrosine-protein phosphatase Q
MIISYRIIIAEVGSGERVLETTTAATDTLLIINDLDPHFTYRCSIAAVTVAVGPETSAEVTTLQEGNSYCMIMYTPLSILHTCIAPSGSPRNATVSVIDSSRVEFEWVAPSVEDSNGVVVGYVVRVTGQDSNEVIELQTNTSRVQVENLHPFYSYVFTVAARTEAGVGPFSPVIHLQMPSAGKLKDQLVMHSSM